MVIGESKSRNLQKKIKPPDIVDWNDLACCNNEDSKEDTGGKLEEG
jgi:hypothetical protein